MTIEDAIKHLKELPFLSLKSNTDWAVEQDIKNQVAVNMAIKALEQEPKPKVGRWIYDGDRIICSKCHTAFGFISLKLVTNFCAECGADMRGEKE